MARPGLKQVTNRLLILKAVVAHAMSAPPRHLRNGVSKEHGQTCADESAQMAEAARQAYWTPLLESPVAAEMSPWEREFAKASAASMTGEQQMTGCWRIESLKALLWAAGLLESLGPPDAPATPDVLNRISAEALHSARLKDRKDIENQRNLAELWHWRSRTEGLIREGYPFPEMNTGPKSFLEVVKMTAQAALEKGDIEETIRGDFPAKGKAYRELAADEWAEVTSICVERHHALNWLCGHAPNNRWDETPTHT